jgi:hypothetical protein
MKDSAESESATPGNNRGIEMVTMTDPNENAFTVPLPKGWQNQAYSLRIQGIHRTVVTTQSPEGGAFLWMGDPNLPGFTEPTPDMYPGHPFANLNPMMQVLAYVPAEPFFHHYLQQRHSHAPGFRITDSAPCPAMEQQIQADAQKQGMNVWITTVSISYDFTDQGRPMRARLHGTTFSIGAVWVAEVMGIVTTADRDPTEYDGLLFFIRQSSKTNPEWRQQQDRRHQQQMQQNAWQHQNTMQQMQQNHQNNLSWIQNSAQQHQIRMDGIHAQGEAQRANWQASQASQNAVSYGDESHQRFTNYIKDEETVVSPSGETSQVETGQERYYKHRSNDTYVGTDSFTERDDLRSRFGVNPDDYEEVSIKR